jgi:glycosyltransferase involved in cell wall biosynthesis
MNAQSVATPMLIPPTSQRLAIFIPSMREGGAERSMIKLAHGLTTHGYGVDLVLAQAEGPHLSEIPASVRVVNLKSRRVLSSLPALMRYLRRERPAALLSVLDYANIVALWARKLVGGPTCIAVNEQNTISISARHSPQRRQRLMPRLVQRFYPWATHIIGNSQGVADDLSQITKLPRQQIQVIYNPVITPEMQQLAAAPLDHPWFAPGQPPVVLATGRLTQQKDFPTLLQAFAQVRQTHPARLLILGEGAERPALEALVTQLGLDGAVSLPGFVENPYAYMARAALFVLSSRWEGLPTVMIEALCCGLPLVATDCPSGPREILRDSEYGQLVPVGNAPALAQAMLTALTGSGPRPVAASWQRFALEPVVNQYIDLLLKN